ncbi:uncharacterized protein LOC122017209 [Zingiber officinale]|uniref:Uncharacterized protein n=1 Tax=Zingiber officinale TaxID=94328 RepID=A0A8J5KA83_ZINOF|nr:uncharacterized protein LOC122017209 [Zingiber officinale]KAG6480750.1 hypothetical protein ZIOFF_057335 [Zingiber officinale]
MEMKCARHPLEDGVGVCATCLRERLLALPAAMDEGMGSSPSPPPAWLSFSGSASPCVPAATGGKLTPVKPSTTPERKHQRSSSWFSALLRGGRGRSKNSSRPVSSSEDTEAAARVDRDMSPENWLESPLPQPGGLLGRQQDNLSPTSEHHRRHCHGGGLSGFAICFNPLATANPNNNRRSRVSEFSFSEEPSRAAAAPPRPQHRVGPATGPALGHDRSWKLVDIGKFR